MRSKAELENAYNAPRTNFKGVADIPIRSQRNMASTARWMEMPGEWRIETSNETNWHVTGSIATEVGVKVKIPFFAAVDTKMTVTLESGGGGSSSRKVTAVLDHDGLMVPAGKVAYWKVEERHQVMKRQWDVPVQFQGIVGSDYGRKHHGHYFWGVYAHNFFYEYTQRNNKYVVNMSDEYGKELRVVAWFQDN